MTLAFEAARTKVAALIGALAEELVFTRGATEAINLLAYSWPDKGRVLLSTLEHHSNIVPWQLAGWQVDVCPLTADGRIDLDAAEAMLTPEHTMVAFAHVSNVLGSVLDATTTRGFAVEHGSVTTGFSSVAVPVLDHRDWPVAAIAVTFRDDEVPEDRLASLATEVRGAATTLSARIHGRARQS